MVSGTTPLQDTRHLWTIYIYWKWGNSSTQITKKKWNPVADPETGLRGWQTINLHGGHYFYRPQTNLAKVMFLHLSVILARRPLFSWHVFTGPRSINESLVRIWYWQGKYILVTKQYYSGPEANLYSLSPNIKTFSYVLVRKAIVFCTSFQASEA